MNWAQIRQLYLGMVGSPQSAGGAESIIHLSEGQRTIAARMPLQETESVETEITTTASQDYVDLPANLFHVNHVYEKVSGQEIIPEEGGMRGRAQYLAPVTGMPPEGGAPNRYAISNNKIYLRPTPDSTDFTIVVRGREALADISESEMGDSPALPEHYHMAVALAAGISFLTTHPKALADLDGGTGGTVERLRAQLEDKLKGQDLPKERERFDNRARVRLRGFRIGRN